MLEWLGSSPSPQAFGAGRLRWGLENRQDSCGPYRLPRHPGPQWTRPLPRPGEPVPRAPSSLQRSVLPRDVVMSQAACSATPGLFISRSVPRFCPRDHVICSGQIPGSSRL